ncbi:polysaccharide pyruvyl transferase family protein [uncultured Bacteroides sp.]|uniref:polysaccharide pyruvyl transferase family protein n=1 Tax=uncultured Bacteroides sp. TaxID=162156 RepID=UPI0025D69E91|nr:polysaccharide pyruvyl transferase family protein [uncultured Bacteroides sp.]
MKIGILTFHCAHNYGAVLQAYALQECLKELNHEVAIIDYRPGYLIKPYQSFYIRRYIRRNIIRGIYLLILEPFLYSKRKIKSHNFDNFIKKKLLLSEYNDLGHTDYDIIILGSDQIWNPNLTGGTFDSVYFGENFKGRIVSYAASMGIGRIPEKSKEKVKKMLQRIYMIGVRETSMIRPLQQLCLNSKISLTLDPTLLAGKTVFDRIKITPSVNKTYVLVYQVVVIPETYRIANEIARQIGAEVFYCGASLKVNAKDNYDQTASPEAFVGYFANASCVVSTSFHGTAFSVIYNRPFYTIKLGSETDLRSNSFLENIGLSHRMIEKDSSPVFSEIDYSDANKHLLDMRIKSLDYLISATKEDTSI